MKPNLKVAASENANGREQIAFSLQALNIFIQLVSFFMKIPPTNSFTVAREENFNIQQTDLLSVGRWLIRNPKHHSKTHGLTWFEWLSEIHTTVRVSHISPAIVTVYGETATLPAWETEGWVGRSEEPNGESGINLVLRLMAEMVTTAAKPKNLHFKVDDFGVLSDQRRI
jgi:hypothetical protein